MQNGVMIMAAKKDLRIYPAVFFHDDDAICVEFPDLPGCVTFGETMEEALESAKEALEGFLYGMEQDDDPIPPPTPFDKIAVEKGGVLMAIAVRMDIVREEEAHRSITKSVTIPAYLNKLGIENNLNFSSILQEGLKERLGV
jgi:predicted RNase H-like HicB family nuclease